ncbi:phosrestin I, putative [Pediculus humanus corporis]|uniref:Phosrestin I, putative n=1 Tax=Pediculus humanus subsp. corporis TaxID=121224 RepID=E0VGH1_PEDHC|nr:phosrestin I, putative [Pediculus humanus corporis]EEB12477.1 phosrestin I, putative [Pediculus humanus corporis]
MLALILLTCVAAIKVFKKSTPNGKITVYLGKRDFIDHLDHTDPIDGIVVVEDDYLQGKKIFGQLTTTYRFGREEDEVMGLKFSRELILVNGQIVPGNYDKENLTPVQERLIKKFPTNAFPFTFKFPVNSPSSVTLQLGDGSTGKPLGVHYSIKCLVGDNEEERGHKKSTVSLVVKKYAPVIPISLEVTLDKELYYHGEGLGINILISNSSKKTVKNIKFYAVQHCEVTMINTQYSKYVASLETREGCPVTPGNSFSKKFFLVPLASCNKDKFGVALDGYIKDDDVNLASSTLVEEGKNPKESLGIIICYSVRVKLNCGTLGGELVTDVPFKLMHPAPGSAEEKKMKTLNKTKSIDRSNFDNTYQSGEDEDNIIFEDYTKLRKAESEDY